ncbi:MULTISPECIES: PqiC family protein [Dyella]|uniref:Membrane integrity-associated transporter subunit PqiC n=2 Tax=Dyella TaxID=231454 RepID=A0A4R0YSW5_9GAMM|nr:MULTISPECIES: PqiC family protein [Dyella]TBR39986.1 membrane integrity-associated transporter subunit PqiC [Dyella terrae]TCI12433.1 membrane integrity-associated transporter subunit PqiC [Dyella soli]
MIHKGIRILALGTVIGLCACGGSAPVRYYTLVPPVGGEVATATGAAIPATPASFQFELLPVGVPAQADQPSLVVRQGGQGVAVLDGERWIAPLGDEVRNALSADLAAQLHSQDVTGLASTGKPVARIKVDLRRFDSVPGSYAMIDAAWSVRMLKGDGVIACTSRIQQNVGTTYESVVQGHQRALAELATQIATAAVPLAAGQSASCPAS